MGKELSVLRKQLLCSSRAVATGERESCQYSRGEGGVLAVAVGCH